MYDNELLAKRIRDARDARGWSQGRLGKEMGRNGAPLTQAQVAKLEAGDRHLRATEAAALADALDVSLDVLLERSARPVGDLDYARTIQVNQARNIRGLVDQMVQVVGRSVAIANYADPHNELGKLTKSTQGLHSALVGVVAVCDQVLAEGTRS